MKKTYNYNLYIGATLVIFLFTIMIVSQFWTPYDPNAINAAAKLQPPSAEYWLGTDNFGRDILSRLMQGSQTAFVIGIASVSIGLFGGLILGALAGYFGGWTDEVIMRVNDATMAIPGILFAIMLVSIFDAGLINTIIALGVPRMATFTRVIRGGFLQVKNYNFVKSSRIKGSTHWHIMSQHILPNILTQITVATTLSFSSTILSEAGLSYLGLGVQPPDASWGRMLSEAKAYITSAPWYIISIGIAITLLVFGFNLLGDGIRKMQDVKGV